MAEEGGSTTGEPERPAALCADPQPLGFGDAEWVKAPFEPPGDMGMPGEDDDEEPWDDGIGFIEDPDGGGVSFECDVWSQDCPQGEKCTAWANDGGMRFNATRCSPLASFPSSVGESCNVAGGPYSGIDDCNARSMCWEASPDTLEGTCAAFCTGDESNPLCQLDHWCFIGGEGSLAVCLPDSLCAHDGVCQCMCPDLGDPDCEADQCDGQQARTDGLPPPDPRLKAPPVHAADEPPQCPDNSDPLVLYMSNDDSNSQASAAFARRVIHEGGVVPPGRVRIHEFLNYYDLSGPSESDSPAEVSMEMRRTDPDSGEFTLMLRARGRHMTIDDRPPMNLVFSLDTSGSMEGERIELLKDSMAAAVGQLRAGDVVSIVTWNTEQATVLAGYTPLGPDDPALVGIIEGIAAGGGTDLHAGLVAAYDLANTYHIPGGINRVMLISDGGANAGVTDLDLIASQAATADGGGTYLVGVGVGIAEGYRDDLMDAVTDAGKGAYMFIDDPAEAEKQLGERFLANTAISARNVRMKLSLPWYFGIKRFHGEEISGNPAEVEPQHLGPNDAMVFHQILSACDPDAITTCDAITAEVEYTDPYTGLTHGNLETASIESLVTQPVPLLYKADVVVGYAKALIVIGYLMQDGATAQAIEVANNMHAWASEAAAELGDDEVQEIADIMAGYAVSLAS